MINGFIALDMQELKISPSLALIMTLLHYI